MQIFVTIIVIIDSSVWGVPKLIAKFTIDSIMTHRQFDISSYAWQSSKNKTFNIHEHYVCNVIF